MPDLGKTPNARPRAPRAHERLPIPEPTVSPPVTIVARWAESGVPAVQYENSDPTSPYQSWIVRGHCNQCGLCVIGLMNVEDYEWHGPPGTPMAVTDKRVAQGRADEPVFPGFIEDMRDQAAETPTATVDGCSLAIEVVTLREHASGPQE